MGYEDGSKELPLRNESRYVMQPAAICYAASSHYDEATPRLSSCRSQILMESAVIISGKLRCVEVKGKGKSSGEKG
jgi:hypothetical protein